MTDRNKYEQCFLCEEGRMVPSSDLKHKFRYGSREYVVDDLSHATCDRCGTSGLLNGQLTENKNRIKEFQNALIKIMGPSDILSLRAKSVSYTHLRAHETRHDLVCRLLLEKKT